MKFLHYFDELITIDKHLSLAYKELQIISQAICRTGNLDISKMDENLSMALYERRMIIQDVINELETEKSVIWGQIDEHLKKKGD